MDPTNVLASARARLDSLGRLSLHELRRARRLLFWVRVLARIRPDDRQSLLLWAALVGGAAAIAALAFGAAIQGMQFLLTGSSGGSVALFQALPWEQRLAVPVVGGLLAGLVLMLGERLVRSKATDYMEAVVLGDGRLPVRATLVRSASALFSITSGEAIGREGPLVQLAALAASLAARLRCLAPARRRVLVACGAAAGLASAYHAPLGAALFVAEIVIGSIAMETLGPLLISSVVATLVTRALSGAEPLYAYSGPVLERPAQILFYAALGLLAGAGAHVWMRLLRRSKAVFLLLPGPAWSRLALGGLVVGALAIWHPEVTGNGASLIRGLVEDGYVVHLVTLLLALKVTATLAAFGSGAAGGVFTPSLFVGAAGGYLFARVAELALPGHVPAAAGLALAGMGAFLAAATSAPITAILMVFEMTLHYDLVLPLMVAAAIAYATARGLRAGSLYDEGLRRGSEPVFERPLAELHVADLMRPHADTVPLNGRFREIARRFLASGSRELCVVNEAGALRGMILLPDVAPWLQDPHLAEAVLARDILREDVPVLAPTDSLPAALDRISRGGWEKLPVVEPTTGRLLGETGAADLSLTISEVLRRSRHQPARP